MNIRMHETHLDAMHFCFLKSRRHILQAESGAPLREAEPCTVVGLSYLIADDGMDATYASLKLRLDDVASPMKGGHFYVRLPPPFVGGADFVVPKSRFDAAIRRKWTIDDHCQVRPPASHAVSPQYST